MTLGDPLFLLLLVPLLAVVVTRFRRRRAAVDGGSELLLARLPTSWRARLGWLPGALATLAAALLVVALARPLQGREASRVVTEGIDILMVVDISSSMREAGLEARVPNIDVVKEVVHDFVSAREDDRIGLVTFAAYPKTECPLTLDKSAVLAHVAAVECVRRNGPEDGTGIGAAIGHAARKLMESDAESRVVVLLTDGAENQMTIDPMEAAALCAEKGIEVYTIGAGTHWSRGLLGGPREVPMPTEMLEQVAATTGGRFFRAKDTEALERTYAEIDELERTEREDVRYTEYDDLYRWVLVPAAVLLVVELLLRRGLFLEIVP